MINFLILMAVIIYVTKIIMIVKIIKKVNLKNPITIIIWMSFNFIIIFSYLNFIILIVILLTIKFLLQYPILLLLLIHEFIQYLKEISSIHKDKNYFNLINLYQFLQLKVYFLFNFYY